MPLGTACRWDLPLLSQKKEKKSSAEKKAKRNKSCAFGSFEGHSALNIKQQDRTVQTLSRITGMHRQAMCENVCMELENVRRFTNENAIRKRCGYYWNSRKEQDQ